MLIELTSPVNEAQLDEELRVALGLVERPGVSVRQPEPDEPGALRVGDDDDTIDEDVVRATVAAHVPDPAFGRDPVDVEAEEREREVDALLEPLRDKAVAVRDGGGSVLFTNREVQMILAAVVLRPRGGR